MKYETDEEMERALEGLPMWEKVVHCWLDDFSNVNFVQFLEKNKILLLWNLFATYLSVRVDEKGFKETLPGFFFVYKKGGRDK